MDIALWELKSTVSLKGTIVIHAVLLSIFSNYNTTFEDPREQYHDTQALSGVWTAVWQLLLAMVVKVLLTIFTFGMKVCTHH